MATSAKDLSPAQCTLLAIHYASRADIKALHAFTPSRSDALGLDLVLRILLTYLPEALEPRVYVSYAEQVATRLYLQVDGAAEQGVDTSPVADLKPEQAQKRATKLRAELLPLRPPACPSHVPDDMLTLFLVQRAQQIDEKTGMLGLVPQLVEPYLERNQWVRTWYISVVLPLLRLQLEYYPPSEKTAAVDVSLREFQAMEGKKGVYYLLDKVGGVQDVAVDTPGDKPVGDVMARDMKGIVGPWMYGDSERKRRKLNEKQEVVKTDEVDDGNDRMAELGRGLRKISLSGVSEGDITGHDWEYVFQWLVDHAQVNFPLVTRCIEDWDGPGDVDLGGFQLRPRDYLDGDIQQKLELQYAQAAFATCYAAQTDTKETVSEAHGVLARLADLLDFIPPPDLASSVDALPHIERHATKLDSSQTIADLAPSNLLRPEHPLTTPRLETYMLLQMMVYSAYQFSGLGLAISLVNVAKLRFYATPDEQLDVLKKLLKSLTKSGARKDETQWAADRARLMWLWSWGLDTVDEGGKTEGTGVLGKVVKQKFEAQMLETFVETSGFDMATKLYLKDREVALLPKETVEKIVLAKAMEAYDGASNGNKTRGGVRKAADILAAFRPYFPHSTNFGEAGALIAATHALSFYSLTLQHGVPFQPVSIRVSKDPVGLLDKVLEQNPRSYTKLDDLIGIATNLISAGLNPRGPTAAEDVGKQRKAAERRTTFMAVEAALREDDFETAYSYIINRLTPSGADVVAPVPTIATHKRTVSKSSIRQPEDDTSWRAAFLAGRYRPSASAPPTLRRLEQRTELLSLALSLAPTSALTEILAAWRRCEEETTAAQRAEEEFDARADDGKHISTSTSALPGGFVIGGEQPEMIMGQKRREVGRLRGSGIGEAPMSMFDLTRSAAGALSRNAFPLGSGSRSGKAATARADAGLQHSRTESFDGQQRVRKRDMVASAVSGSLASGLGWVLGATPVDAERQHQGGE